MEDTTGRQVSRLRDWHQEKLRTDPAYAKAVREVHLSQTIADVIVDARIRAGLTQGQLARKARLTQAQISQLESGTANPKVETAERVLNALRKIIDVNQQAIRDAVMAGVLASEPELAAEAVTAVTLCAPTFTVPASGAGLAPDNYQIENVVDDVEVIAHAANSNLAMAA